MECHIKNNKEMECPIDQGKEIDVQGFIGKILVDDDIYSILEILKKNEFYSIQYCSVKEFPYLFKCKIEYLIGNIERCEFSFLFKFKKYEE